MTSSKMPLTDKDGHLTKAFQKEKHDIDRLFDLIDSIKLIVCHSGIVPFVRLKLIQCHFAYLIRNIMSSFMIRFQ